MAVERLPFEHFEEERRAHRRLGGGTLACPACDAPVALPGPVSPAAALACPWCGHDAVVRDFLALGAPTRPARSEGRVVPRRGAGARARRGGRAPLGPGGPVGPCLAVVLVREPPQVHEQ